MQKTIITNIIQNWKSALTVSLVSIPLSLALAIASGATPTQGIITAFWAGILGGIFGGSNYNITGPTGALSGILVSYAFVHGYMSLPVIAVLSGIIILISYLLKLDKYIIFIPSSVIHGFTLGVAFIISFGQLDNALGLFNIEKTNSLVKNIWISLEHFGDVQWPIILIFLFCTIFILIWNKKFPTMPGAIVVAFFGVIGAMIFQNSDSSYFQLLTLGDKYPNINASLFENSFNQFSISILMNQDIWLISIATSIIAILETLLSGQIADNMTGTKFNRPKEVLGLSIANIGTGLMGGIPATAALARTALNIKSGANHKTSCAISAIFIGIITLFLFNFFKLLPMVVIAAILTTVAIGMIEKKHFINLINNEKTSFILSILVAIVTVVEDPIVGILVGTFVALLIFVNKISYGQTEILFGKNGKMIGSVLKNEFLKKEPFDSDIIVYKISGTLTYINMPGHIETVKKIKGNKYVVISLRHAFYADIDGIEYLNEIIEILKKQNEHIIITGINDEIKNLVINQDFYKKKLVEGKIYDRTSDALRSILKQY